MIALSLCGAVLSLAVLIINLRTWWKGNREIKSLIPFAGGLINGSAWTLCVGGLLGWVAISTAAAGSTAGDWAVSHATGKGGGTLSHGSMGALTPAGACAVVVSLIVGAAVFKGLGKTDKKRVLGGLFVGLTLCATAGFAQVMQWIPDLYNGVGGLGQSALNGALSL